MSGGPGKYDTIGSTEAKRQPLTSRLKITAALTIYSVLPASLAQLEEHLSCKQEAIGSRPMRGPLVEAKDPGYFPC